MVASLRWHDRRKLLITLKNISLQRGTRFLLEDVDLTLYARHKIGFIGANGSGKSSLFALLRGVLLADKGDITFPTHLRVAHLAQETPALPQAAIEFVMDGDHELRRLEALLAETTDGNALANLYADYAALDGYTAKARAAQLLHGLGFTAAQYEQPVSAFSGGWRMRLNLAQTLMCPSDLMLLDEPTNHLDLDAVLWLEAWLKAYPGTLLLISHDRDFLDNVVDHIAHLENQKIKLYTGNYSSFEQQRAAMLAMQQATFEKQQRQRAHVQSYVDRFRYKASKARQAQSRLKALERMEVIQAAQVNSPFEFEFKEPVGFSNPLMRLDHVDAGYGDKTILKNINFNIEPGLRLGLLGPNGAGKSTLIQMIAGTLAPQTGERTEGSKLQLGYFAQHQVDHLFLDESPLQHMQRIDPKITESQARKFLGGFDFCNDTVFDPIQLFSGGEKARLALALLVWQRPNLLLLDEPTNHLDLEMREALTFALQSYEGALVVVSHDRHLIRTTTDNLMLVAHGKVEPFDGDLEAYEKWLIEFRRNSFKAAVKAEATKNTANNKHALETRMNTLEKTIQKLQTEMRAVEMVLADNTLYDAANKMQLDKQLALQAKLQEKLQTAELEWLETVEKLEQ